MKKIIYALGLIISQLTLAPNGHTISLDEFQGTHRVEATDVISNAGSVVQRQGVIGQYRSIEVANNGSMLSVVGETTNCKTPEGLIRCLSHAQSPSTTGSTTVTWDGDSSIGLTNPTGLGGLDLTQDGANEFEILVTSFDFVDLKPLDITLRVYSSDDSSGNTFAESTIQVNQLIGLPVSAPTLPSWLMEIPFSTFATTSTVPVMDIIRSVGAIQLLIDGKFAAFDFQMAFIGTNGVCMQIPRVDRPVVDDCGVCSGDNSSCMDCLDQPNGNALPGIECSTGDIGVCGQGKWNGACSCELITEQSEEICDDLDNDCDGETDEDQACCTPVPCPSCESAQLDAGAKRVENGIKRVVRQIKKIIPVSPARKKYRGVLREAFSLQDKNWKLAWSLPQKRFDCEESYSTCEAIDNSAVLTEYLENNERLWKIFKRVTRELRQYQNGYQSTEQRKERRSIKKKYLENFTLASSISSIQYSCY